MIYHTHRDFYVVQKPSGLGMHQEGDAVGIISVLNELTAEQLFPVHRLDKDTSGLLLVARHQAAAAEFGRLFESRAIEKYYLAIGGTKPNKKQGAIVGDMVKARNGSWRLTPQTSNPARTYFFSHGTHMGGRLYVLRPVTGRTHQLRVALKSIGAPIHGDRRYKGQEAARLQLHASALRFDWQGEPQTFVNLPQASEQFLAPDWTAFEKVATPWDYSWPR